MKLVSITLVDDHEPPPSRPRRAGNGGVTAPACRDERVAKSFPDGVLWTTGGHDAAGPDLANKVNEMSERLCGPRPSFTDAEKAAEYLGNLLADKKCLLVIDDVWRRSQLEPFTAVGKSCRWLVISRFRRAWKGEDVGLQGSANGPAVEAAVAAFADGWKSPHPHAWDDLLADDQRRFRRSPVRTTSEVCGTRATRSGNSRGPVQKAMA